LNTYQYCLRIGDTSLILGQRLSEWCGHGPMLEEDIAISNISLDLIGQARLIFSYAAQISEKNITEDDIAFTRDARAYRNLLMAELPNGDFGNTILKQYLLSVFQYHQYSLLQKSKNESLAAFAVKSLKEISYHVRHAGAWVLRLGDGTQESNLRMQESLNDLWNYTDDLFDADELEKSLTTDGIAADISIIKVLWTKQVIALLGEATLIIPQTNNFLRKGSRQGNHTEHLGYMLAEMQFLPRAYPGAKW
jgi:ring-1,2-phenylacetyl-CoA epoxidase subunit PaaC